MERIPRRFTDLDPEQRARAIAQTNVARRTVGTVLDVLGPKLPVERLRSLTGYHRAGEPALTVDTLAAELVKGRIPLTLAERDLVAGILTPFGGNAGPEYRFLSDPDGVLAHLTVIDDDGRQLSPPIDFDAENWWPRDLAVNLWGRVGGHLHGTGIPHKTTFPETWDAERLNAAVLDVARNPDEVPIADRNGNWITRGTRDDVRIEVRLRADGSITFGYPLGGLGVHRNDAEGNPQSTW